MFNVLKQADESLCTCKDSSLMTDGGKLGQSH